MSAPDEENAECQSLLFERNDEKDIDFRLRIKCNSPGVDPPPQEGTKGEVNGRDWYSVWTRNEVSVKEFKDEVREAIGETAKGRYMRLIAKGRLLAPDTANMGDFKLEPEDYIHAVIAPVGVRGGQQAEMAQPGVPSDGDSRLLAARRAFRSVGIGPNGVILSRRERRETSDEGGTGDDSSGESSDDEQNNGEATNDIEAGRGGSLRSRPRRGLDRLRAEYRLNRDEISAIRLYFRRSIDRFAESRRRRAEENESSAEGEHDDQGPSSSTQGASSNPDARVSATEGRRRLREERWEIEEAWMDAQGPRSEFRMNLNTNNVSALTTTPAAILTRGGRRSMFEMDGPPRMDTSGRNGTSVASMAVGTDREFLWGFFMGFFMGFVMLFWMWMPSVSHKQKMGILTGIAFQIGFNKIKQVNDGEGGNPLDLDMRSTGSANDGGSGSLLP